MRFIINNILKEFHSIIILEWRETSEHFMYETTKTPPINFYTVPLFSYDLWS